LGYDPKWLQVDQWRICSNLRGRAQLHADPRDGKPVFVVIWYSSPHRVFQASEADSAPFASLDPGSRDHHGELVAMD